MASIQYLAALILLYFLVGSEHRKCRGGKNKSRCSGNSGCSTSSRLSTVEILYIITQLQNSKYRKSTKDTYMTVWRKFNEFFVKLDTKPTNWEDRILLFVGYLVQEKRQSATIKNFISAIKAVLSDNNISVNEDRFLLNSLTRACRLHFDTVTVKLSIYKELLLTIISYTGEYFARQGQQYLAILYQAMFATAYYGLFRVGEITFSQHSVKACDVHIADNKRKILFVLRSSKTHNHGHPPQLIKIRNYMTHDASQSTQNRDHQKNLFCPYQLIRNYLSVCRSYIDQKEIFFVFLDRSPVYPHHFTFVLKHILQFTGFDSTKYSSHAFRAGRAGDLLRYGMPVEMIKKLGRWKLNAVYHYFRNI